jgi:phosphoribosylformylglycinamidine synthase
MRPKILILHATGTNRDHDAAWACELAGGDPEVVHVNQVASGDRRLSDYRMLVLPGGFSYGDDLGAGKLWAVALRHRLGDQIAAHVEAGRPVLGICNGFQVLVKAGLLPGIGERRVTLTRNDSGRFECRWVTLLPEPESPCVFTRDLTEPIFCPVAHGEGRLVTRDAETLAELEAKGLAALRYGGDGVEAGYPANPNGSQNDIAGLCNEAGTVFGLMPHPEDHVRPEQHPERHRGAKGRLGLPLFTNGIRYATQV